MKAFHSLTLAATIAGLMLGSVNLAVADDAHHPKDAPKAAEPAPQTTPMEPGKGMDMGGMMDPAKMKMMQEMHGKMMGGDMAMGPKGDTGPASQAYAAANSKMHQDMAITFTGDADVDFVKGMIPHHQGAIETAKVVLQYGKDSETKKLAEGIIKAQEGEIAVMTEWLKTRAK
jgi:hypothetical protein